MAGAIRPEVMDKLSMEYIPRARWWPWKGVSKELKILHISEAGDLVYIIFEAEGFAFQLPLLRKRGSPPPELSSRAICVGELCYVEAEYFPEYLSLFQSIEGAELEIIAGIPGSITSAAPLSLESTNSVALYRGSPQDLVLKSYRLIPRVNTEYLMLRKLAEANYKHIPRVRAFLKFRGTVVGILMDYVRGVGDGGKPFYENLVSYLSDPSVKLPIALSSKLGVIISGMHGALNKGARDEFYGVEEVSERDVEGWLARMERYARYSLRRLDEVISSLSGEQREELSYWRGLLEKYSQRAIEVARGLADYQLRLLKGRAHQDLHLAQMIYIEESQDFVITDFEGEPGRSEEERLAKEPLLRDIASMLRSFHYLSHAAIMNAYGLSVHEASQKMIGGDPSRAWRARVANAMLYAYVSDALALGILSREPTQVISNLQAYLKPWIIERALYEIYYESLYRPTWASIPIAGLVEAVER